MHELPFEIERTHAEDAVWHEIKRMNGEAMHAQALAARFSMPERLVRQCVSNLRKMGKPILSGNDGYWMARTPEDIDRCVASLHRRALEILTVMSRLKKNPLYAEMVGQLELALEEK